MKWKSPVKRSEMNAKLKYLLILLSILTITTMVSAQDFWGINCGGPYWMYFTNSQGDEFIPDQPYSNGIGYVGSNMSIGGPRRPVSDNEGLDSLYFFWREGDFSYIFDVPTGLYAVNIYLREMIFHWNDFRVFSICIEGDTVETNIDIFATANYGSALPVRYLVQCEDQQINIDFIPNIDYPEVSAISVRRVYPDYDPPLQLTGFNAIDGYQMNIIYWDFTVADDLAGYRVYRRQSGEEWQLITPEIHRLYRYHDFDVQTGIEYEYMATCMDLWGNESLPSDSSFAVAHPFEETLLPRYYFDITEENLHLLNVNVWSYDYVEADFTLEGEYFQACSLRYRGSNIRTFQKKSYRFKLLDGMTHNGWQRFNVNAMYGDSSMIREEIAYEAHDSLGCLNPETRFLHVERHAESLDEFLGVYLEVERIDNDFLERRGLSSAGNLYKCKGELNILPGYQSYVNLYSKVNNETTTDWYDLIEFIEWINLSSDEEFHDGLNDRFRLDDYLDVYVGLIATQDTDFPGNNYYLFNNPVDDRWVHIAWDHNETFDDPYSPINLGTQEHPGTMAEWNRLLERVLADTLFRYSYCKKLERFLANTFTIPNLEGRIQEIYDEIFVDALRDYYKRDWGRPEGFLGGPAVLNEFVETRIPFLQGEIPLYVTAPELGLHFRLNEIQSDNQSTITDEMGDYDPWIEIYNRAPVELDLEGFTLTYGIESWTLPEEAVVDAEDFIIIWLDGEPDEGALHSSFSITQGSGNLELRSSSNYLADSEAFPNLSPDQVWGRDIDGAGVWVGTLTPTPGSTNTPLPDPGSLVVNEFLARNVATNSDPYGEYEDWVEIYNPTDQEIPLGGIYLTDDFSRPTRWAFPDTSITPFGFLLIWTDNDPEQGPLHTTFALSGNGEQIGLYDRDGETVIDTLTFGEQSDDISYGRYPDGGDNWYFLTPTPDAPNSAPEVTAVGIELMNIPEEFMLSPAFPNPFNPKTTISFGLPVKSQVQITVFDIQGRQVGEMFNEVLSAGYHEVIWNAAHRSSGIYFYRMEADDFICVRKMLLLK